MKNLSIVVVALYVMFNLTALFDGKINVYQFVVGFTAPGLFLAALWTGWLIRRGWKAARQVKAETLGRAAGRLAKAGDRFKTAMKTTRDA